MTQIIDGRLIAEKIRAEIKEQALNFKSQYGYSPGLGVVLAGDDPASAQYVRMKRRACEAVGIESFAHIFDTTVTQNEVLRVIEDMNNDPKIHGILVQLPLFSHIDEETILKAVSQDKDADGFHPINIGAIGMKGREPLFTPATPTGCMVILEEIGAQVSGANAVVVGRSNIVGLPVALMLLKANATVTVAHSQTKNLPELLKNADIVIAAIGRPNYIDGSWLKTGAVVIDVGTNQVEDATASNGYRFVGDVDIESAKGIASAITRVPGGVGPLTITMLLKNTMKAAWRIAENTSS